MFNLLGLLATIPTTILVFGIIVIAMSVFLIIAVLMQQGKQHGLSGAISGAADTFFGKSKGSTISKKLSVLTSIVAIIFVVIVLAFYIVQTPNDEADVPETTAAAQTTDANPADSDALDSAADAVSDAVDSAADAVSDAVDSAADAVSDAVDSAADAVSDAVDSAADAVSDAVDSVADAVSDAVESN